MATVEGYRIPSFKDIDFQVRPGTAELNCCSVNAPRIVGLLSQWACMTDDKGIYVNYYGNYDAEIQLDETKVHISQKSNYPMEGKISLCINAEVGKEFTVYLRIPCWSETATIRVQNKDMQVRGGSYFPIRQKWEMKEYIELELDICPHYWKGEKEQSGKASVYYGPVLLAFDGAFNQENDLPHFDAETLCLENIREGGEEAWLLLDTNTPDGRKATLCDFRSAGYMGREYKTWFPIRNVEETGFLKKDYRPAKK